MNLLLDTHTFIWFINGDKKLPKQLINKIKDIENRVFISVASLWEIVILISLDKLSIKDGFNKISEFIVNNEMEIKPVTFHRLPSIIKIKILSQRSL